MENKILYKLITPYKCKICGQDMLFFTTPSGTIIDYKEFLNRGNTLSEMKTYLEKRNIKYIKCICCDKLFIIDWSNGWPEQVTDIRILRDFGI